MPLTSYDFELVVDVSGTAISKLQDAYRIEGFGVKCDPASVWEYDIQDRDGFPVASSEGTTGPITGPNSVPVNRRTVGFYFRLRNATPGTYQIRVNAD